VAQFYVRCENVVHVLRARETLVGRSSSCTITLSHAKVSRVHAVFRLRDDGVEVVDLGSMNGTRVNGQRLRGPRVLTVGDQIQIGGASFELLAERAGEDPVSPTAITTNSADSGGGVDAPATLDLVTMLVESGADAEATSASARALVDNLFARLLQGGQALDAEARARLDGLIDVLVRDLSPHEARAWRERVQTRAAEVERLASEREP
jgi:pSer/pThr/pTyr-binding forkhead associated (FHA) protein